jgi:hypothetical protein
MASEKCFLWSPIEADKRGNAIAAALETGNDPTTNQDLAGLMYVKYYSGARAPGARDDDLSHEFVNAIIDAAYYHRSLDNKQDLTINPTAFAFVQKLASLTQDAAQWYSRYINLMVRSGGMADNVQEWNGNPGANGDWTAAVGDLVTVARAALSNPSQYRVNLKKRSESGPSYFAESLPLYRGFGGYGITGRNGEYQRYNTSMAHDDLIKDMYTQIVKNGTYQDIIAFASFNDAYQVQGRPTLLSVKVSENVRRALFDIAKAKISDASEIPADYGDYVDLCDGNKWACDETGFYTIVNGQRISYGVEDVASQQLLKAGHSCYSTGVNAATEGQCNSYIFECLLDSKDGADLDLDKCIKNYDSIGNFFEVAQKEIDNMHPIIAIRTLQKFGFRTHQVYDENAGQPLKKIEHVNHWLRNFVDKKFDAEKAKAVRSQGKLLHYLGMLVSFVNSNCGILNKGIKATSEEAAGIMKPSEYMRSLGIEARVVPNDDTSSLHYDIARFRPQFQQYSAAQNAPFKMAGLGQPMGLSTPFGSTISPGAQVLVSQTGGNGAQTSQLLRKLQGNYSGALLIKQILASVRNALSARGKQLNPTDVAKLEEKVKLLMDTESELIKTISYIEEYNKLMDMFRDYTVAELSVAELERFVKRHSNLKNKQVAMEEYLLRILEKLSKFASEDENGKMTKL